MTLKTTLPEKTAPAAAPAPPVDTVTLELALYTNYTWGDTTYEKGSAYKFTRDDAMFLLSEQDHGRPIWRQWTPPKPKRSQQMPIVDSTEVQAVRTRQSQEEVALRGGRGINTGRKIEVGNDDEIQDILGRPDGDASGDVTV